MVHHDSVEDKERSETVLSYGLHTTELPPSIEFYLDEAERTGLRRDASRPSIGDLLEDVVASETALPTQSPPTQVTSVNEVLENESKEKKQKKFGWIEGVYVRCLQNIIGVILYLRLAWVAGQAGALLGCLIILIAALVTTVTTISTAAITTNGEVKGGGVYYMISRTLGPEFGGSIGLIFCCANAVGAALYVVGFGETVRDVITSHGAKIIDGAENDVRIIGVALAILLMAIIVIGISIESLLQQIMLIPFVISVGAYLVGSFIHTDEKELKGFTGFSWTTFSSNILPDFRGQTFFSTFSIYFPAATGIMAGANISGDLKNPQMAIPRGTLLAILSASFIYMGTLLLSAATFVRDADGTTRTHIENGKVIHPACASNNTCTYGLSNDFQTLTTLSAWGPLITVGIFASTLSSALASLVSAPKVFQAVASDNLFPYLGFFKKGYGRNNDPRRAYALTFAITTGIVLIGDLNAIAPIISNFFLCTYALVNYACFDASYSETPGFRPGFKFYNKWISLGGALACLIIMFVMSWPTALGTLCAFAAIFLFLKKNKPDVNWGSSTQANQYKSALQGLLRIDKRDDHVKNYRPQILVLTGDPSTRPGLVDFAASISRGSCLLVCANILTHVPSHRFYSMMRRSDIRAKSWLRERGIRSFSVTVCAQNLHEGTMNLSQTYGIGKLVPNILFVGFKCDWTRGTSMLEECNNYVAAIKCGFENHLSVCVLRNRSEGFDVLDGAKRNAMKRASTQWPRGSPPRGRLSVNPEKHADLFNGGTLSFLKGIGKRASRAQISDCSETEGAYRQSFDADIEKTPRPSTDIVQHPSPFCVRIKKATIDVWWLSDDGGLTLLLPHLLTQEKSYLEGARLRVFTVSTAAEESLQKEKESMEALMAKFRIDFSEHQAVTGIEAKPNAKTIETFDTLIAPYRTHMRDPPEGMITDDDLNTNRAKTYRHLRCGELLHKYSEDSELVIVTLPVPSHGLPSTLYLGWLEALSRGLPPTLLVRGNHESVLTFYS